MGKRRDDDDDDDDFGLRTPTRKPRKKKPSERESGKRKRETGRTKRESGKQRGAERKRETSRSTRRPTGKHERLELVAFEKMRWQRICDGKTNGTIGMEIMEQLAWKK